MFKPNPLLLTQGFAPAAVVARVLSKSVSTVHRMEQDGRISGTRDGRSLYINLFSLLGYYKDNRPLAAEIERLIAECKNGHVA